MKKILLATAVLACFCTVPAMAATRAVPAAAPAATWINPFATFSVAPNSLYGDFGFVAAVNQNLNSDGFLVRLQGFAGHYSYKRSAVLTQDVDYFGGSAMGGYHWFLQKGGLVSLYGGFDVQDHENSDTGAKVRNTRVGAKGLAEVFMPISSDFYADGSASFSTAWNSYYAQGQVGYKALSSLSVGPEVAALGNDRFSGVRTGGFASVDVLKNVQLIGGVGYNFDTHTDPFGNDDGVYGTVHVRATY